MVLDADQKIGECLQWMDEFSGKVRKGSLTMCNAIDTDPRRVKRRAQVNTPTPFSSKWTLDWPKTFVADTITPHSMISTSVNAWSNITLVSI